MTTKKEEDLLNEADILGEDKCDSRMAGFQKKLLEKNFDCLNKQKNTLIVVDSKNDIMIW